ncbi:MAG: FMN-binding glutamate synthase family protein [Gammaproteobacteria bacterium]|nr:FMN-binding glutamate synthase family protein [Gammaproteobacteria bacterium]
MRRQWYLGFGIIFLIVLARSVIWGHIGWVAVVFVPLAMLWVYDVCQKNHSILRNFPVLGHVRYILEFIRPEIQQYFIANDEDERPYNREVRSIIYQRAKNVRDTIPFGTSQNILKDGYHWVLHSLASKPTSAVESRISIGGPDCTKPYLASRLNVSAMSFGSLSANAIMAINLGSKLGKFAHNTGEGGISSYHLQGGDLVFQLGTAYFGCRNEQGQFDDDLFASEAGRDEVKAIEIKLSQGAKPSHGGILPGVKVTAEIAEIRKIKMKEDALSPSIHSTFDSPRGLLLFIKKLRQLSDGKPIGFKLCIGHKEDFLGICKAMLETKILPDFITIDGAEGGTGAAPLEFANHIGEPLTAGLIFVHNALVGVGLRDKIRIVCSGKIATGFDMVLRIAMGADICQNGRAMMMAVGCVQAKQCNANTCPTGVATQNKRLQRGLVVDRKQHHVVAYHRNTMQSFLQIVGAMGLTNPSELSPDYVMQRLTHHSSKSLSEIYEYLAVGQLLGSEIPESFKKYWASATADHFK